MSVDVAGRGVGVHLTGVVHLYPSAEGEVVALRGVDLDVGAGEAVALLGPSAAGKSTVLGLLAGEFPPSAGSVRVGDLDVGSMGPEALTQLRARDVSLVVQGSAANLLPYATAYENVWFAQHGARRRRYPLQRGADELLEVVGLAPLRETRVDEMSAGQRQRVALASGIAVIPRLLLIDEPTSQLNAEERDEVIDVVNDIHGHFGMTVVAVTHDPEVASHFERTVTIRDGLVGAEGRDGHEYAVVGRDGSVQLPPDALEVLPPESLVRVVRRTDGVDLRRHEEPNDAPDGQSGE